MRPLSAQQLIDAWERGDAQDSIERSLTLLAAASPDETREALAQLPIGVRDTLLLTLREWTFGEHLVSLTQCPNCSEQLELAFKVADIRASATPFQKEILEGDRSIRLSVDGQVLTFRLPNSADLRAVSYMTEVVGARRALLERCLLSENQTSAYDLRTLPDPIADTVAEKMAEIDPQANVQLAMDCPNCGHHWQGLFDIVSFFWSEIDAWARRILRQVHTIASAYGWGQAEILSLSPQRRQMYLDLIGG